MFRTQECRDALAQARNRLIDSGRRYGRHAQLPEFLEVILEDELVVRKDRKIARRTKAVAFREEKSLLDFHSEFNTSVNRKQVFDLAAGDFVRNTTIRSWLVLPARERAISFRR